MSTLHNAHVQTLRDILSYEISDTYKDIYGMRPRFYNYKALSVVFLMCEADALMDELDRIIKEGNIEDEHDALIEKYEEEDRTRFEIADTQLSQYEDLDWVS